MIHLYTIITLSIAGLIAFFCWYYWEKVAKYVSWIGMGLVSILVLFLIYVFVYGIIEVIVL